MDLMNGHTSMNATIYHSKVFRNPGREILKLLLVKLKEKMIDIDQLSCHLRWDDYYIEERCVSAMRGSGFKYITFSSCLVISSDFASAPSPTVKQ